jgi:YD repeat-containing protein
MLAALALPAAPQTQQRVYDSAGRSVGTTSTDSAGTTRYYDERGRSLGTSSTDSAGTTRYYDPRGRTLGSDTVRARRLGTVGR